MPITQKLLKIALLTIAVQTLAPAVATALTNADRADSLAHRTDAMNRQLSSLHRCVSHGDTSAIAQHRVTHASGRLLHLNAAVLRLDRLSRDAGEIDAPRVRLAKLNMRVARADAFALRLHSLAQLERSDPAYLRLSRAMNSVRSWAAAWRSTTRTILASGGPNGSITPAGKLAVSRDREATFAIVPASHYRVADVLVDGRSVGAVTSYTFRGVTTSHTITASFTRVQHTISVTPTSGGTITPTGQLTVDDGDSQSFAVSAAAGCTVIDVAVDGRSLLLAPPTPADANLIPRSDGSYACMFSNISGDHTLTASFAPEQTQLTCQYGFHMDLTWDGDAKRRASEVAAVRDVLHAQVSRNSLLWHEIESVRGVRNWDRTDAVVAELGAAGIEPVFTVIGSPAWANGVPDTTPDQRLYVPTEPTAYHTWLVEFTDFISGAAARYKGSVNKWEIWGEENDSYTWKPEPNQAQYNALYSATRKAILEQDPSAQVAIGGLSGLEACGGITGKAFLQGMYDAGVYPDYVAIHPYTTGPARGPDVRVPWENSFSDIQTIRNVQIANGAEVPIWVTEWGWSLDDVSETEQAAFLQRSLDMIRTQYTYVTVATLFMDYDHYGFRYGLLRNDLTPRPAAAIFREFVDRTE